MLAIRCFIRALNVDERGATAVEYALICSLIVLAMVAGVTSLAGALAEHWSYIDSSI